MYVVKIFSILVFYYNKLIKFEDLGMPIFTFSTKTKKPEDTKAVEEVKAYCEKHHIHFSSVVISKLKEFNEEVEKNGRHY